MGSRRSDRKLDRKHSELEAGRRVLDLVAGGMVLTALGVLAIAVPAAIQGKVLDRMLVVVLAVAILQLWVGVGLRFRHEWARRAVMWISTFVCIVCCILIVDSVFRGPATRGWNLGEIRWLGTTALLGLALLSMLVIRYFSREAVKRIFRRPLDWVNSSDS